MCNNCEIVKTAFEGAKTEPHLNYLPVHAMLKQVRLEVYAGDCRFDEMTDILKKEAHYTVCFYLKCPECGIFYLFGACVRGEPIFKNVSDITTVDIEKML